ncbi:hypothetical protein HS088_TW13G00460 [Tripterygium wilfordii]|uniref:Methyltransferase type 11 domain-containing protein n=1 Tax=Tripterygium wilfordii TaxID=458696 RepID=A0A7J7CTX0_TRIWF|nr:uncharacterized protein LOC120013587 [Tripterygium wilfordii]KAF5737575.1 hypothetical protein HS088_TW13G00460 [Tripterygium wilfordii]
MHVFGGSIARRVILRAFLLALVMSIVPLVHILSGSNLGLLDPLTTPECAFDYGTNWLMNRLLIPGSSGSVRYMENVNLTVDVVRELMRMQMLTNYSAKALCLGEGSASAVMALRDLGFSHVCGVNKSPFSLLKHKNLVYQLDFEGNSYDFVLFNEMDKFLVPAILVLEIERVLKPSGIGAVLVGGWALNPNGLIGAATPVSILLRDSRVVHVGYVAELILVVFKKKNENVGYFEQFELPADCQSVMDSKPLMDYLEPLVDGKPVEFEKRIAYLPKLMDISSKKHMVYIDIGAGEHLKSGDENWFFPSYPVDRKAFSSYFVDHNTSVMLSYVKKPGITFVYYPDLAGNKATAMPDAIEELDPYVEYGSFDFLAWFKETAQHADFMVLKMNAGKVELEFLAELFKSGAICMVDELFLVCSDQVYGKGAVEGQCLDLFKGLRSRGVFAHQWWETEQSLSFSKL